MTRTETITLNSDGSAMNVFVARPEFPKAPGLILFQEAYGVTDYIRDIAQRLAHEGYVTAAPELFHRTAPPGFTINYTDFGAAAPHYQATNTDTIASDAKAVYEWLKSDLHVDNSSIGAIGFCLGGRCAYIANATLPIQAAVSFYGGGIASILDLAGSQSGPALFFWGGLDQHIGPDQRHAVAEAMSKAGKSATTVEISDANHAFFRDVGQTYNPTASKHAWALTRSFLETNLKG